MWPRSALRITALALAAGAALWAQSAGSPNPPQKPLEELPSGPMQSKATTACMECHDARIILQQRLGKAAWTREVDKMMKGGALVASTDRHPLIDSLSPKFGSEPPPYQPPRPAAA